MGEERILTRVWQQALGSLDQWEQSASANHLWGKEQEFGGLHLALQLVPGRMGHP